MTPADSVIPAGTEGGSPLRLAILGSGSSGNAALLESAGTRILLDAGFSCRELEARLTALGVDPSSVDAIFLTHEHGDHARGAVRFARRFGTTVAGTPATLRACGFRSGSAALLPLEGSRGLRLGGWTFLTAPVPHDATDPVAFRVQTPEGSVGYALDLGHAPAGLVRFLGECDTLILESNHDRRMLEEGPYPRELKERLRGPRGHLANDEAAEVIEAVSMSAVRRLVLAHLSRTNNRAELVLAAAREALGRRAATVRVTVAGSEAAGWLCA